MVKFFDVAGHVFSLSMADGNHTWQMMDNYAPFQVGPSESVVGRCLFSICVGSKIPDGESVYICGGNYEDPCETVVKVFAHAGGYLFEIRPNAMSEDNFLLWLDNGFSYGILKECGNPQLGRFQIDNACMIAYALRTARESTLAMHASVVVKDDCGYLFLGRSGAGKSTHSRMWLESIDGTRLLNDDNPVVRVLENGEVRVYGSPWSGKTSCYVNDSCPVGGFVRIVQHPSNGISMTGLLDSYGILYESCSGLNMDTVVTDCLHRTMEKILDRIGFWRLECLPDAEAARMCYINVSNGNAATAE